MPSLLFDSESYPQGVTHVCNMNTCKTTEMQKERKKKKKDSVLRMDANPNSPNQG